jgi:hypothetical protein
MSSNFDVMYEQTSIGRPIDPSYFPNLLILIVMPIVGIIAGLWSLFNGETLWQATQAGLWTGAVALLTWILAREIDIDHDYSAFVGVGLAVLAMLSFGSPPVGVFACFLLVPLTRIVSRIVGPEPKLTDSAQVIVLSLVVAYFANWIILLVAILALVVDALLINPLRRHLAFAGAVALIFVGRIVILDYDSLGTLSAQYWGALIVISLLYGLTIITTRAMQQGCDLPDYTLDVKRVRAAMVIALAGAIIVALWNGDTGMILMLPLWAALLGAGLYNIPHIIRTLIATQQKAG